MLKHLTLLFVLLFVAVQARTRQEVFSTVSTMSTSYINSYLLAYKLKVTMTSPASYTVYFYLNASVPSSSVNAVKASIETALTGYGLSTSEYAVYVASTYFYVSCYGSTSTSSSSTGYSYTTSYTSSYAYTGYNYYTGYSYIPPYYSYNYNNNGSSNFTGTMIGIGIGGFVLLGLIFGVVMYIIRRRALQNSNYSVAGDDAPTEMQVMDTSVAPTATTPAPYMMQQPIFYTNVAPGQIQTVVPQGYMQTGAGNPVVVYLPAQNTNMGYPTNVNYV
eukprot:TRINITY_DN1406_c0_g1_i1.p1 TRINITY_DN1406_c0_g1~~TRINITY_DN1406_c0_g1_i1.p1  ORF type:complete len:275 (-),score=47.73 TRINITY_DN1406_c0_g1_i1:80-904(-)